FEDVGNVVAAECSKFESVFDGARDFVRAIDFTQGHDFGDVNPGIEATILKLAIILLGTRAKSIKTQEQFGVAGLASLIEQILDVIWVFEVPVPIVATGVGGDRIHPLTRGGIEYIQAIRQYQSVEEIFLYVPDTGFDAAFFIWPSHVTS